MAEEYLQSLVLIQLDYSSAGPRADAQHNYFVIVLRKFPALGRYDLDEAIAGNVVCMLVNFILAFSVIRQLAVVWCAGLNHDGCTFVDAAMNRPGAARIKDGATFPNRGIPANAKQPKIGNQSAVGFDLMVGIEPLPSSV